MSFLQIIPRFPGTEAGLSGFLTGTSVFDPFEGVVRNFGDLSLRQAGLRAVVCPSEPPPDGGTGGAGGSPGTDGGRSMDGGGVGGTTGMTGGGGTTGTGGFMTGGRTGTGMAGRGAGGAAGTT